MEFERNFGPRKTSVELWDCSGDHQKFEATWPAIMKDARAVIIVFDPQNRAHETEVELWYEWFVKNPQLSDNQCLCFSHSKTPSLQGIQART